MRLFRIFAVSMAVFAFAGVPQAKADDCDPAVMAAISDSATQGLYRMDDIVTTLLKPPAPVASSNCMQSLFNIWQIDPMLLASAIFPTGTLGYTIGGFTLTQSSPAALVLGIIQSYFNTKFGSMVCGELWKGIGQAMSPLSFLADGGVKIDKALGANFPGLSAAVGFIEGTGFSTDVRFFPGTTMHGTITYTP